VFPAISLSKACDAILGRPLLKDEQTSNWEALELSPSQLTYAALDAHCLLGILHAVIGHLGFSPSGVEVSVKDTSKLGKSPHCSARSTTPPPNTAAATAFVPPDIGVAGMYHSSSRSSVTANTDSISADITSDSTDTHTAPTDMDSETVAEKPLKCFVRENRKPRPVITLAKFFSDIA
jgi:hypothetical protein